MKKHFLITITALMAVMVSSCKKDNDELDNPNGPWSVELTAECIAQDDDEFEIEFAGTGIVTIDWGDGTVLKNLRMPELKKLSEEEDGEEYYWYEGTRYTHKYSKVGTYAVKISGQDGSIILLDICVDDGNEGNRYTSLVLNHCGWLQYFNCMGNRLTTLDVGKCTQLKYLDSGQNPLVALDINGCTQLEELWCEANQLYSLDINECTQLKVLYCAENRLTSLDVSGCTQLEVLKCNENQLTSLDVSKNRQLKWLECYENQLTTLDVSKNRQLKGLGCNGNHLPVATMNQIYKDLPIVEDGSLRVDKATAGDYYIAENKGWQVFFW